jgi:hypothetical protein
MEAYPALKWHPETGDCKQFERADDVPDGWLDTHPANQLAAPVLNAAAITREEIVSALKAGNVVHKASEGTSKLLALLTREVHDTLKRLGHEFDPSADVRALLAKLGPPAA